MLQTRHASVLLGINGNSLNSFCVEKQADQSVLLVATAKTHTQQATRILPNLLSHDLCIDLTGAAAVCFGRVFDFVYESCLCWP